MNECVVFENVNRECPIVEPVFEERYPRIYAELPEVIHINSEDVPQYSLTKELFKRSVGILASRRVIPYTIATEYRNGHYNTTYTWQSIERILRTIESRKLVQYVRVRSGARLTFLQSSRDLGRGVAAVATKSQGLIRFNPTFNFGGNLSYCDRVVFHEMFHLTGSSAHTNPNDARPLMHPYGGTLDTLMPIDETYITAYAWINNSVRFSTTPNLFSQIGSLEERGVCGIERSWADKWGSWVAP